MNAEAIQAYDHYHDADFQADSAGDNRVNGKRLQVP